MARFGGGGCQGIVLPPSCYSILVSEDRGSANEQATLPLKNHMTPTHGSLCCCHTLNRPCQLIYTSEDRVKAVGATVTGPEFEDETIHGLSL